MRRYTVMLSLIGWAHTQNDRWTVMSTYSRSGVNLSCCLLPKMPGNASVRTQHCGYWCTDAKAPGHQSVSTVPIKYSGPVSYKDITITFTVNQGWGQVKYLYLVLGTWCKISSTWYLLVLDTLKFKSTWYLLVLEGKVLDTCPSTLKYFCQINMYIQA